LVVAILFSVVLIIIVGLIIVATCIHGIYLNQYDLRMEEIASTGYEPISSQTDGTTLQEDEQDEVVPLIGRSRLTTWHGRYCLVLPLKSLILY
jgi:hypothetical protein